MRLEKLEIERRRWIDDKLHGEIKFSGDLGKIEVTLDEEQIKRVLAVVADSLVACAQETATKLTASVIEASGNRLPAPEGIAA